MKILNREIFDEALKIRNKQSKLTYNELNDKYGSPFKDGESLRQSVKRELKKQGKLPSNNSNIELNVIKSIEEVKQQKDELKQIKKEYQDFEKEIKKLEGQEERRLKVIEHGDYYVISSKTRDLKISIEKVKLIKQVYCDENGLEINALCRKLDIPRRDFMLVKSAFNITHDDTPFLDEELDGDIDELVNNTLERKKNQYFLKLAEKEIEDLKNEVKKYRSKDYLFNKIIENLEALEIQPISYSIDIRRNLPYREALLDLADLHLGEKFSNFFNSYSVEIARQRFNQLTQDVLITCGELGVDVLHVSNLGDDITGIIHDALTRESEISVEEQVVLAVELIGKMLIEFSLVFDKVVYADVFGNHSRIFTNKTADSEKANFEFFVSWGLKLKLQNFKNIIFESNTIDNTVIVKEINGVTIYEVHGNFDKFNTVGTDLSMMLGKVSEVHMGHLHNNKGDEQHCVEVFLTRSFIGVNTYAKNIRKTSKAGQRLFIYEKGKRKYIEDIILN